MKNRFADLVDRRKAYSDSEFQNKLFFPGEFRWPIGTYSEMHV